MREPEPDPIITVMSNTNETIKRSQSLSLRITPDQDNESHEVSKTKENDI